MKIKAINHDWLRDNLASLISITYYTPYESATYDDPAYDAVVEADVFVGFFKKIKLNSYICTFIDNDEYTNDNRYKVFNGFIEMPCDFADDAVELAEHDAETREAEELIQQYEAQQEAA